MGYLVQQLSKCILKKNVNVRDKIDYTAIFQKVQRHCCTNSAIHIFMFFIIFLFLDIRNKII